MNSIEVGNIFTNGKLSREIIKIDGGDIYYKTELGKEKSCWITTFQDWVNKAHKSKEFITWRTELEKIQKCSQRQDSVTEQMIDLIEVANKLGFYDAADYIRRIVNEK